MPSKTDLLRRERDDQRKLADHWKLQHDDYKKLNAKLASRAEDLEAEVSRLTAEVERLRTALRMFLGASYPVATEINKRGYNWSEAYLDEALHEARAALSGDKHE